MKVVLRLFRVVTVSTMGHSAVATLCFGPRQRAMVAAPGAAYCITIVQKCIATTAVSKMALVCGVSGISFVDYPDTACTGWRSYLTIGLFYPAEQDRKYFID